MKNDYVLKKKKDFKNLFNNKTCYYSSFFTLFVVKNDLDYFRYAISVNKKNEKKAVNRNKIKRQIRAILKDNPNKNIPFDVLIMTKRDILNVSFFKKKQDLLNLISKISLKSYSKKEKSIKKESKGVK